jgi:hypothetical protein
VSELDRLSLVLLGERTTGRWCRQGQERAIIAKLKYGAVAQTLTEELMRLSQDARVILAEGKPHSPLSAAAYYHVRFENIHPLHDRNGRVGRTIMTGQLYQAYGYPPAIFEQHMKARFAEYRAAFKAPDSRRTHQDLLVMLSGFVGITLPVDALDCNYSFEPLFPSPGKPGLNPRNDFNAERLSPSQYGQRL